MTLIIVCLLMAGQEFKSPTEPWKLEGIKAPYEIGQNWIYADGRMSRGPLTPDKQVRVVLSRTLRVGEPVQPPPGCEVETMESKP